MAQLGLMKPITIIKDAGAGAGKDAGCYPGSPSGVCMVVKDDYARSRLDLLAFFPVGFKCPCMELIVLLPESWFLFCIVPEPLGNSRKKKQTHFTLQRLYEKAG